MSDDSDFTAPCSETRDGVRCVVPRRFADGTPIAHDHSYPTHYPQAPTVHVFIGRAHPFGYWVSVTFETPDARYVSGPNWRLTQLGALTRGERIADRLREAGALDA